MSVDKVCKLEREGRKEKFASLASADKHAAKSGSEKHARQATDNEMELHV